MNEQISGTVLASNPDDLEKELQKNNQSSGKTEPSKYNSQEADNFCVGIVDIVNSTRTIAKLSQTKSSKYYEIYLNHMANIIEKCNGIVLKTMGDSLLYYFPDSKHSGRNYGFLSCLECGFTIIDSHGKLNEKLQAENLPKIDFRISADYGNVSIMKNDSASIDLVGPTINTCSKINGTAPINEMVIGSDLYAKTKIFSEFDFKKIQSFSSGLKYSYQLYLVKRKN